MVSAPALRRGGIFLPGEVIFCNKMKGNLQFFRIVSRNCSAYSCFACMDRGEVVYCFRKNPSFPQRRKDDPMKRTVSILLAAALLALCLCGCSLFRKHTEEPAPQVEELTPQQHVEQLVSDCTDACHDMDVEGILDCVNPKLADPMRSMLKVAGMSGKSDEEMLELVGTYMGAEATDYSEFCETLSTELGDVEVHGEKANTTVTYTFEQDGQTFRGEADVSFIRVDGQWYISTLQAK